MTTIGRVLGLLDADGAVAVTEPVRYVEPFLGSGAVYLGLRATGVPMGEAWLSDANPRLVAFHVAIRDQVDDVLAELSRFPVDDSYREAYAVVRNAHNAGRGAGPAHAARLLWLNKTCFNGLYRENGSGAFNVPVGDYAAPSLPSEAHVRAVSVLLQGARIEAMEFADVFVRAVLEGRRDEDGQVFVYCDPPYWPLSKTASFTAYTGGESGESGESGEGSGGESGASRRPKARTGFGPTDQARLATCARMAGDAGAVVVVSNHDLSEVRRCYADLEVADQFLVRRSVSRNGGGRAKVGEVLLRTWPLVHAGADPVETGLLQGWVDSLVAEAKGSTP